MPPTSELFTLRERERQKLKEERAKERQLRVHEKTTYASRLNAQTASLRKQVLTPEKAPRHGVGDKESGIHEDTEFVLTTTKDRHIEKENLVSYVNRKREMFLVQFSLGVKREEIRKLEEIAKVIVHVMTLLWVWTICTQCKIVWQIWSASISTWHDCNVAK